MLFLPPFCLFVTSPTGSVAKYCMSTLPIFLCMLPMAVARSSSGRVMKSQGEGAILDVCPGHSKALAIFAAASAPAFAAEVIIQSPITSCSRRDYSVCQASANSNLENSECRRCGVSAVKGLMGVYSAGEVSIALFHLSLLIPLFITL